MSDLPELSDIVKNLVNKGEYSLLSDPETENFILTMENYHYLLDKNGGFIEQITHKFPENAILVEIGGFNG